MTRFNWGPAPIPSVHEVRKDLLTIMDPVDADWDLPPDTELISSDWYVELDPRTLREVAIAPSLAYPGGNVTAWKVVRTEEYRSFECEFDYLTGEKKGLWH